MQIEKGINPNCSELVIRLENYKSVDKITDELEKINIREYLLNNYYDFIPSKPTKWDGEDHHKEIIAVKTLPKKVQKLLKDTDNYQNEVEQKIAQTKLLKFGIDAYSSPIVLLDGDQALKMPNGTISIAKDHDGDGPAIVGHQHCNWDMFPLLKKISEYFGEEVHAYDGGSIDDYEDFLNGKEPEYE